MKRLTLGALALLAVLLTALQGASATTFTITKPWTTVRARPAADAAAVGLAFGNDALPVVQHSGDWLAVRLPNGRRGWVRAADGEAPRGALRRPQAPRTTALDAPPTALGTPLEPPHMMLVQARGLQSRGKTAEAREALVQVVLREPDDLAFYEAVRRLNYYHAVDEFPTLRGRLPSPGMLERARAAAAPLLLREGRARLAEGRPLDAAAVLEPALLTRSTPLVRRAAEGALHEALTAFIGGSQRDVDPRERVLAEALFKLYFPAQPLPDGGTRVAGRR